MQNLAYLDEDGNIHSVNDLDYDFEDKPMLGATAPMNLDALADHAAAEKAELKKQVEEAARQAEWLKTHGLSERERKLQEHAAAEAKILKLQKGQYMNLDALADHAAAEKAELKKQVEEAARQAEWMKTHGLSERERKLQEHAAAEAKILKLQKGQYMNLDALADHAAAEQAELKKQVEEAARQAEWKKTHGLSERDRRLQEHAAAEA